MHEEYEVKMSALSQSVEVDGKKVDVQIYENGNGAWLLEVVDELNNSTVWDDAFPSEQDALSEFHNTVKEEGIDSLIGPFDSVRH